MKSKVITKYDRTNKLYNIRVRIDDEGFQDEIVLQFKPDDELLTHGIATILKDTTDEYTVGNTYPVNAAQLLAVLLDGGY